MNKYIFFVYFLIILMSCEVGNTDGGEEHYLEATQTSNQKQDVNDSIDHDSGH